MMSDGKINNNIHTAVKIYEEVVAAARALSLLVRTVRDGDGV